MSTPFDRAEYAVGNLTHGEFLAAAQSLTNPDALSPEEQKSVSDRLLGGKPGLLSHVLKVATNPLVIVGAVLSMKYPIPRATNLLKYRGELETLSRTEFPGLKWLPDLFEIFDRKTAALIEHAVRSVHLWNESNITELNTALGKYVKSGGKITNENMVKVGVALDDLGRPDHPSWQFLRRIIPDGERLLPRGVSPIQAGVGATEKWLAAENTQLYEKQIGMFEKFLGEAGIKEVNYLLKKRGVTMEGIKKLNNYFPHIESLTKEQADLIYQQWASKMGISEGTYNKIISESVGNQLSKNLLPRHGIMLPSEEHLKAAGLFTPELESAYKYADAWAADSGKSIRRYSLHSLETFQNYTHDMARSYAWTVPPEGGTEGVGKQIASQLHKLDVSDRHRAAILRDTYIPMASGHLTWSQSLQSMWFAGQRQKAAELVKSLPLPNDLKGFLLKPLESPVGWGFHSVGHRITNYFYGTSLAFNMLSPVANLTQSLLTSIPMMGIGNWMKGAAEATRRGKNLLKLMSEGMPFEEALSRAMPEFVGSGLNVGTFDARRRLQSAVDAAKLEIGPTTSVGEAWNKFQKIGMSFFTGTETFNRSAHFYGARQWFLRDAVGEQWVDNLTGKTHILTRGTHHMDEAAGEFAALTTRAAHYGGGLLGTPRGIAQWWAPLKQYMQFPMRTLGFFTGPAVRMGGEGGRMNFGTLGRSLLASSLAVGIGKEAAGIDLSRMMMFGSIPTLQEPSEHNPLGVLPMAPPLVQMGAGAAGFLATGDTGFLRRQLPMMVPGGVQLARVAQAFSPSISTAIGRTYADYSRKTPDGKIPLMNAEGRLITTLTPLQVWGRAMGVPLTAIQHEAELAEYLTKQRDQIRQLRGAYTEAIVDSNPQKAAEINAEYMHRYPGMGEIVVKKSDIRATQMRREVPRLDRILATLPPEARGKFMEAISSSMGVAAAQSLESGTPFMSGPTLPVQRSAGSAATPGYTGVGAGSKERRGDDTGSFGGFGSFGKGF